MRRDEGRREEEKEGERIKESKENGKGWHGEFSITCMTHYECNFSVL